MAPAPCYSVNKRKRGRHMTDIRPFRAYRPKKGMEQLIAALPYDVYNREEACEVVAKNPESFLAIDRAETQFSKDVDTYAPEVYRKAKEMLRERIADGRFVQEDKPCYYLYEQIMDGRSQTGIVACASIDDYLENRIKKHENTRADKELDRINHVDITNMQTGPIFLAYRSTDALCSVVSAAKVEKPIYDFVSEDGITHRVWVISEEEKISSIRTAFEQIDSVYIADGHHRCASAVKVGLKRRSEHPDYDGTEEFNFFLSVLFPDEELKIMDYNRVVYDLNGRTSKEFLEEVSKSFEIICVGEKAYHPEAKGSFGMYLDRKWYRLTARETLKSKDPVKGLDVSILQDNLLKPILGIQDPKTDKRIDFVGGIRGLEELERRCAEKDGMVAFSMYPTSIHELFEVADANLLMPPKSTWFEPKLRSGLFLHGLS